MPERIGITFVCSERQPEPVGRLGMNIASISGSARRPFIMTKEAGVSSPPSRRRASLDLGLYRSYVFSLPELIR